MNAFRTWVGTHQVVSFFIVAFGISWPLFAISIFLFSGNMAVGGTLGSLAVFAPALAGMAVAALSDTEPRARQGLKRTAAFLLSWIFSSIVLILFIWRVRGIPLQAGIAIFCSLVALLPAWVISGSFSRIEGVREFLSTLTRPKGDAVWYLIALFTFPAIQLAGYAITRSIGREAGALFENGFNALFVVTIILTFFNGFLFAGGINEESGWRGFAIPRLQKRFSPIIAALIVWFFWALWHLFYDISSGASLSSILTNRLFFNMMWSVLFVWVFNRTKCSILAPALFHPSMNTFSELLPRTDIATFLFAALTVYAVISERMWKRRSS